MKTHIVQSLAEPVDNLWKHFQIESRGSSFNVATPLSSTPLPIYAWVAKHAAEFGDWSNVQFVLMDEQVEGVERPFEYIDGDDPASYEGFARKYFFRFAKDKIQCFSNSPEARSAKYSIVLSTN
jgi:6-phosphogluconolactonase/glucosamine-6-phosphate isomerase/deaminase